ncbi:hypothetical protein [Limosilactobacillus reuteri]|nr:hypothetical protein [Limosilactobacillus reuteri]
MKRVYFYDEKTGQLTDSEQVSDTLIITAGITDVPVPKGLVNPKFNVENQSWSGTVLEDWLKEQQTNYRALLKEHPELIPDDEKQRELLMQQSQQITVLQAMVMQQDQDNVKLQKANAKQASQIKQLQQMFMVADQQQAIEKSKEVTAQ